MLKFGKEPGSYRGIGDSEKNVKQSLECLTKGVSLVYQITTNTNDMKNMIPAAVILASNKINTENAKFGVEQVRAILAQLGVQHGIISYCITNGVSIYTTINGIKVRISDHSVSNFVRMHQEAHVKLQNVCDPEAWAHALAKCGVEGYGKVMSHYDMREFDGSATAEFKPSDIVRNLGQVRVSKAGKPVYRYQVWTPVYKSAKIC